MRFGLLGEKLGHSYSPELHAFFGDYEYELFEVAPDQLGDFIRNGDFQGLNVTIPYKTTMLALCDDLTEAAAAIGSVNTVVRHPDGSLFGQDEDQPRRRHFRRDHERDAAGVPGGGQAHPLHRPGPGQREPVPGRGHETGNSRPTRPLHRPAGGAVRGGRCRHCGL
mgnify:CR=1 FL=1